MASDSSERVTMEREAYEDWLAHHGILGQKWGQRNGPPYPLGSAQMSTAEKHKRQQKVVKDITKTQKQKYYVGPDSDSYRKEKLLERNEDVASLLRDQVLNSAYKDVEKIYDEELKEYFESDAVKGRAMMLAYMNHAKDLYKEADADIENNVKDIRKNPEKGLYLEDDWDDGIGNSFHMYMLEKGKSIADLAKRLDEAEKIIDGRISEISKELLGDYSKTQIKAAKGYEMNASSFVRDAVVKGMNDSYKNERNAWWASYLMNGALTDAGGAKELEAKEKVYKERLKSGWYD